MTKTLSAETDVDDRMRERHIEDKEKIRDCKDITSL